MEKYHIPYYAQRMDLVQNYDFNQSKGYQIGKIIHSKDFQ